MLGNFLSWVIEGRVDSMVRERLEGAKIRFQKLTFALLDLEISKSRKFATSRYIHEVEA
jgi:hypothetical protein